MQPLLNTDFQVLAYIFAIPAVAFWLESKYDLFKKINPCILAIFVSMFLSNIGVIPTSHAVYDQVYALAVPLAIPMLLFGVNIKEWAKLARPAVISFAIACIGVTLTVFVTGLFMNVGPEGWKIGGMLIGTYTGGSMNLAGVGTALNASPTTYVVTNAADLVLFSVYIGALFFFPPLLKKYYKTTIIDTVVDDSGAPESFWKPAQINLYNLSWLFALPMIVVAVSKGLANLTPGSMRSAIFIILLTTISLVLAQLKPVQQIRGNNELGNYLLHMFFAAIGAEAYIPTIVQAGPAIAIWVAVVIVVAALFHFIVARLFNIDLETIIITSNAAIGGPTTAVAMAIAMKWKPMVVTGLITGLMGYAIGNYLGITIAHLLRAFRPDYFIGLLQQLAGAF